MNKKEQTIGALRSILQKVEEAHEAEIVEVDRIFKIIDRDVIPHLGQRHWGMAPGRETITITVRINGGGDDGL